MPKEIYQVQPPRGNSTDDLNSLVEQLNFVLFEISKRLGDLNIPNVGIENATTVSNLVDALIEAGIGKES
jgi:DNA-binding LacI/PurR family transcriptional regulator